MRYHYDKAMQGSTVRNRPIHSFFIFIFRVSGWLATTASADASVPRELRGGSREEGRRLREGRSGKTKKGGSGDLVRIESGMKYDEGIGSGINLIKWSTLIYEGCGEKIWEICETATEFRTLNFRKNIYNIERAQ